MDLSVSFLLGVLVASTKALAIASVGFGIAWWRGRARLRRLEADRIDSLALAERLDRLEAGLESIASTIDRIAANQPLAPLLPPPNDAERPDWPNPLPGARSTPV